MRWVIPSRAADAWHSFCAHCARVLPHNYCMERTLSRTTRLTSPYTSAGLATTTQAAAGSPSVVFSDFTRAIFARRTVPGDTRNFPPITTDAETIVRLTPEAATADVLRGKLRLISYLQPYDPLYFAGARAHCDFKPVDLQAQKNTMLGRCLTPMLGSTEHAALGRTIACSRAVHPTCAPLPIPPALQPAGRAFRSRTTRSRSPASLPRARNLLLQYWCAKRSNYPVAEARAAASAYCNMAVRTALRR